MKITDTHVYFYSGKQVFSNFYNTPNQFTDPITGIKFSSSEKAFMWRKANFFNDHITQKLIEYEEESSEVKRLGRLVRNYNEDAWSIVRFGFMIYVNLLKYTQNPEFAKQLIDTGNRILVEASPYDKVWGVMLEENDPLILDAKNWKGQNLLGHSLEIVRFMSRPENLNK